MAESPYKYYSVYDRKTDMPVIIHGNTYECMEVLGISRSTLYCYATHTKNGTRKCRYEIFVDLEDEDGNG